MKLSALLCLLLGAVPNGLFAQLATSPTKATAGLTLGKTWNTKMQGGSATLADLKRVLERSGKPAVDLARHDDLIVLPQPAVAYLSSRRAAEKILPIKGTMASSAAVATPGFPRGSLLFYSYDARDLGHFNKLIVVVDGLDQVVAVQALAETPRASLPGATGRFTCYNFIQHRVVGSPRAYGRHSIAAAPGTQGTFFIDSELYDGGKLKEVSRTYLVQPFIDLILHCIELNESGAQR